MASQLATEIEQALREAMQRADQDMTVVQGSHYALCTQGQDAFGSYAPRLDVSEVAEIAARVAAKE
jgi:hypothetical protein